MVRGGSVVIPFLIYKPSGCQHCSDWMKREELFQNFLYALLLSAFLVLYFILSMNCRLAADDFYFLKNFEDYGWWNSMTLSWNSWISRWASVLLLNSVFALYKLTGNFLFYHMIMLIVLCFAIYRLCSYAIGFLIRRRILRREALADIANLPRHSRFSVLMLISFFFLTPDIGETFFWTTSTAMYLWGFIALCFLLAEVLKEDQSFQSFAICFLMALFTGGAAEAVSIPAILLVSIIIIFQLRRKSFRMTSLFSLIMLLISVGITYAGVGRAIRQGVLPEVSLWQTAIITMKSFLSVELFMVKQKTAWAVLLAGAWIGFMGNRSASKPLSLSFILKLAAWYGLLMVIFLLPACYLLGEIPPQRAWILISFLNTVCITGAGYVTGMYLRRSYLTLLISSAAVIFLIAMNLKVAVDQKSIVTEYSRAVDSRMQFLSTLADPEDPSTIILERLPASGMLTSSEIFIDTSDFRNRHLRNYFKLKGALRIN